MYIFQQISVEPESLLKAHGVCVFIIVMSHKSSKLYFTQPVSLMDLKLLLLNKNNSFTRRIIRRLMVSYYLPQYSNFL